MEEELPKILTEAEQIIANHRVEIEYENDGIVAAGGIVAISFYTGLAAVYLAFEKQFPASIIAGTAAVAGLRTVLRMGRT